MSDHDLHDLDAAFAEFRGAVAPYVAPAGIAAAFATAGRRRRVRTVALSLAAAVLMIAPIAGIGLTRGGSYTPDTGVSPSPSVAVESPSPSAVPSVAPSTAPTTSGGSGIGASRQTCDTAATSVPAGGIPLRELCGATLDVPAWNRAGCHSGRVTFSKGAKLVIASTFVNLGSPSLVSDTGVAYPDLDGDGDAETVLILSCGSELWISQVIALERTATGIRTIGKVTETAGQIKRVFGLGVGAAGTVRVQVGDWNAGLGDLDDRTVAQRQWRSYRLAGGAFSQVDGPTSFPPNPRITDLAISGAKLDIGRAPSPGANRDARFTATIRNLGPSPMAYRVVLQLPPLVTMPSAPTGCTVESFSQVNNVTCTGTSLAAGQSRQLTLSFVAAPNVEIFAATMQGTASVEVPADRADPANDNSTAPITITIA